MKKLTFLTNHKGIQGSYLNHLDLQQHLKDKENYRITFYCENVKKLFEVIKLSRREYKFKKGEIKILKKENVITGTIITDFKSIISNRIEGRWLACDKVIIMDSIELTYHLKNLDKARFYYDIDLDDILKQFYTKEILFLMPPCNYKIFKEKYPHLKSKIYFKNINVDVLDTIKFDNNNQCFFRWDTLEDEHIIRKEFGDNCVNFIPEWTLKNGRRVPLKYNESSFIFDYKYLIYRRRKYLEYQEQFGRLIFEYILLNKTVYFFNKPYSDDGLTDYLKHFNIKFDENKIITTRRDLIDKMKDYKDILNELS